MFLQSRGAGAWCEEGGSSHKCMHGLRQRKVPQTMLEISDVVYCGAESTRFVDDELRFVVQPFDGAVVDRHAEVIENSVDRSSAIPASARRREESPGDRATRPPRRRPTACGTESSRSAALTCAWMDAAGPATPTRNAAPRARKSGITEPSLCLLARLYTDPSRPATGDTRGYTRRGTSWPLPHANDSNLPPESVGRVRAKIFRYGSTNSKIQTYLANHVIFLSC